MLQWTGGWELVTIMGKGTQARICWLAKAWHLVQYSADLCLMPGPCKFLTPLLHGQSIAMGPRTESRSSNRKEGIRAAD